MELALGFTLGGKERDRERERERERERFELHFNLKAFDMEQWLEIKEGLQIIKKTSPNKLLPMLFV